MASHAVEQQRPQCTISACLERQVQQIIDRSNRLVSLHVGCHVTRLLLLIETPSGRRESADGKDGLRLNDASHIRCPRLIQCKAASFRLTEHKVAVRSLASVCELPRIKISSFDQITGPSNFGFHHAVPA